MSRRMSRVAVWMQTASHPRGCNTPYAGMTSYSKHTIPAGGEQA